MTEKTEIRFDGWRLRLDTGELLRDGKKQRLTQQPLRILVELLRQPGCVVTRERLVETLWPKGVVDYDNGLNVAVRKLRMVLGDETETPRYIETLPRVGYRFIGSIEAEDAAATVASLTAITAPPAAMVPEKRSRWLFVGTVVGALLIVLLVLQRGNGPPTAEGTARPVDRLAPSEAPIVARRTTSVRAYEHYLQGIFHRSRRDPNSTPQAAIAEFEAALAEDPEYAEAWAGLSDTYVGLGIGHIVPASQAFQKSLAAARRSVELDPGLAETHTALGQIHMFYLRDYAAAEREFALARAANEKYARLWHHIGMLRSFQGRPEEALAAIRRARELEPMTLLFNSNYALVLYHSRRFDDAITHSRELLVAQPALHQSQSVLIRALVAKGEHAEALKRLALRTNEMPNISDGALVYAHAGQRDEARAEITRIEKLSQEGFGVGYELAIAWAALGDLPAACKALDLAWRDSSPFLGWMTLDPRMDPLREQPCFAEVQARVLRK